MTPHSSKDHWVFRWSCFILLTQNTRQALYWCYIYKKVVAEWKGMMCLRSAYLHCVNAQVPLSTKTWVMWCELLLWYAVSCIMLKHVSVAISVMMHHSYHALLMIYIEIKDRGKSSVLFRPCQFANLTFAGSTLVALLLQVLSQHKFTHWGYVQLSAHHSWTEHWSYFCMRITYRSMHEPYGVLICSPCCCCFVFVFKKKKQGRGGGHVLRSHGSDSGEMR